MAQHRTIPIASAAAVARAASPLLAELPPLALYVHFPWCVAKCPYCDFNSHALRGEAPEADYIDALIADLESALPLIWGRRIISIFFGGGTPSLMSAQGFDRLLAALRARLSIVSDAEITLEANPGTADAGRFEAYRAAGANRLSLGIQSFDDAMLARLGRIHDGAGARRAAEMALQHFESVNFDLMYGLPQQDMAGALADLEQALQYAPPHLSCYNLTLEPNTAFAEHPPALPDPDLCADMQEAIEARLAVAGYENYETSAFARPGRRCRHNLNYWSFGDYLGIGAGAHGKLSFPDRILRQVRPRHPKAYFAAAAAGDFVAEQRVLTATDLPFEFMMNALRLTQGVPLAQFSQRTGVSPLAIQGAIRQARTAGLLEEDAAQLRPSLRGRRFLNDLLQLFLA
ncbi:MAG: oxygen-independent coproporphyrinogen III oxidase-like protein [Rhodocyclaceae bacterium]|nr:oxygen-independent coproporphyrinogen III oxidase-like protein [Rhodocyclaceae bacterium]MBX3668497.1 oxygen-independent coproporphyrinogen III oxidase-like protein [Rhodocyclaceae bacterium]